MNNHLFIGYNWVNKIIQELYILYNFYELRYLKYILYIIFNYFESFIDFYLIRFNSEIVKIIVVY